ncbi:MAG: nuclear transport factor 2 family protein, partial [Candidatus Binatia bacterium]
EHRFAREAPVSDSDLEAIRQVKARYFRLMDQKRWDEWSRLFTEDVVFDVSDDVPGSEPIRGRNTVVERVRNAIGAARTVHHGHMPELEITGPTTARGIWAMEDYVEFPPAADGKRRAFRGYGHYEEEYVKETGGWRIARLRLRRIRIDWL